MYIIDERLFDENKIKDIKIFGGTGDVTKDQLKSEINNVVDQIENGSVDFVEINDWQLKQNFLL